jgi:tRNA (cytosine38-C5)-methyltransferase
MEDPRSKAILHLIDLLPKLEAPPRYLFLENVKNFEVTERECKQFIMTNAEMR